MSKYNSYAKRLDDAFRTAREEYQKAYMDLQAARAAHDAASHSSGREKYIGQHETEKARTMAELRAAAARFEEVKRTSFPSLSGEIKQMTKQLHEEVERDNIANPEAVDSNCMELLRSGVLSAADISALVGRYAGNPTMTRIIGKHARDMARTEADPSNRVMLSQAANEAQANETAIVMKWDTLCNAALTYGAVNGREQSSDFIVKMSSHWDDPSVSAAIADF